MRKYISIIILTMSVICMISVNSFSAKETTEIERQNNEMKALTQYELLLENLAN